MDINHADGNAQLGLSIYRQDDWGHGYGREMIVLALRYAFNELNLHRVWLTTSAFNERALKLYEKLGFRHEGREHHPAGRRWDIVHMGICGTSSRAGPFQGQGVVAQANCHESSMSRNTTALVSNPSCRSFSVTRHRRSRSR